MAILPDSKEASVSSSEKGAVFGVDTKTVNVHNTGLACGCLFCWAAIAAACDKKRGN